MKIKWLIFFSIFLLAACRQEKEEETKDSINNDTNLSQSDSSIVTNETTQSSTSLQTIVATESKDISDTMEREEKLVAYNNLETRLKVLLATTVVDQRAETDGLQGFTLNYNFDGSFLFVNLHSGVGVGHPIFKFSFDDTYIYPVEGIVSNDINTVEKSSVSTTPAGKEYLYDKYMNKKEKYDSAIENIQVNEELTNVNFENKKSLINE